MNPFQIEVKLGTLQEAIKQFMGRHADTKEKILRMEGGLEALQKASARISDLHDVLEEARDEDLAGMDVEDQTKAAEFAKRFLHRAVGCIHALTDTLKVSGLKAQGELGAFLVAVTDLEKRHQKERSKLENLAAMIESGDIVIEEGELVQAGEGNSPVGVRPQQSIAAQRRAEEKAASEEGKAPEKSKKAEKKGKKKTEKKASAKTKR